MSEIKIYGGEISWTCWRIRSLGGVEWWLHDEGCVQPNGLALCRHPVSEDVPQEIVDMVKQHEAR